MIDIRDSVEDVLRICKARLSRLDSDTSQDEYLWMRILAAAAEQERIGVRLSGTAEDKMYLADMVVWEYQNRDKPGGMPDWLRLKRREKWLASQIGERDDT